MFLGIRFAFELQAQVLFSFFLFFFSLKDLSFGLFVCYVPISNESVIVEDYTPPTAMGGLDR